jgi:hypothetical protein
VALKHDWTAPAIECQLYINVGIWLLLCGQHPSFVSFCRTVQTTYARALALLLFPAMLQLALACLQVTLLKVLFV